MTEAGFDSIAIEMDLSSRDSTKEIIKKAQEFGEIIDNELDKVGSFEVFGR